MYLNCTAAPEVVRARLQQRKNDASDADWNVHQLKATRWEAPSAKTRWDQEVNTEHADCGQQALDILVRRGLA